jgi:hypothetical protein
LNYTYRMHDPRVGRFFAPDPLEPDYPFYSPYQFSSNSTIMSVELEGLESSKKVNENEKKSNEPSTAQKFFGKVFEGYVDIVSNVSVVFKRNKVKNDTFEHKLVNTLEGTKTIYDETFNIMGMWELAKYGIGGLDDNISLSKSTFGAIKSESSTVKSSMSLMQKVQTRFTFVVKKYSSLVEKYGTESIDFNKSVYEQKISGTGLKTKGLVQWREPGNNKPSPFFTFEGEDPATLGIPKTYTQKFTVELDKAYKFLRTTANTIEAFAPEKDKGINGKYKGGGTQLYSPDAAKNATFTPAN